MYYRRKIILSLLHQFGGTLPRTDFQKLLFLYNQESQTKFYDFVPYKFGCFSFQANQDMSTMIKYGQTSQTEDGWHKIDNIDYLSNLNFKDRIAIVRFYNKFKDLKGKELIRYVYEHYPYYAINSEIADGILDSRHLEVVKKHKPVNKNTTLFTIGYEGKTVESYTNDLLSFDIKVLCDVRKNAKSMKYGFSKKQLQNVLDNVGIQYIHLPELGIISDKRRNLETFEDYNALFEEYKKDVLPLQFEAVDKINDLIKRKKRVALACFEADHNYCHRSIVADQVFKNKKLEYEMIHI